MRQRRQIAGCADRTLDRDTRHDAGVVDRQHGIDYLGPDTGKAARKAADFHRQDQAYRLIGHQFAGADRVRHDQVTLQQFQLIVRNPGLGQFAEAGIDAIGGIASLNDSGDGSGRSVDCFVGGRCQLERHAVGPDTANLCQRDFSGLQSQ